MNTPTNSEAMPLTNFYPTLSFTLPELEARARAWSRADAVITDDGEIHP
jgi:hypothetical protein